MKVINLTPHQISFKGWSLPPSGTVARVAEKVYPPTYKLQQRDASAVWCGGGPGTGLGEVPDCLIDDGIPGVPIFRVDWGEVENLPPQERGTLYVVSALVANAAKRTDLVCPRTARDDSGNIVCTGLVFNVPTLDILPGDGFIDREAVAERKMGQYDRGRLDGIRFVLQSAITCAEQALGTYSAACKALAPFFSAAYAERDRLTPKVDTE